MHQKHIIFMRGTVDCPVLSRMWSWSTTKRGILRPS